MSSDKLLKDLDHIFNITLKNNKSRETFLLFLRKFSEFIDSVVTEYLDKQVSSGRLQEVPKTPFERANLFLELLGSNEIRQIIEEYKNIRLALISDYDIFGEHRKSIKLIFHTTKGDIEYNMDKLKDLIQKAHFLYDYVRKNG